MFITVFTKARDSSFTITGCCTTNTIVTVSLNNTRINHDIISKKPKGVIFPDIPRFVCPGNHSPAWRMSIEEIPLPPNWGDYGDE
jgi:hypothetical protein